MAALLLLLGYLHYAPGTAYSLSPEAYRAWAFPSFRYSDIIWLYLRDGLQDRPVPYVDFPLEYPPLTGLLSFLASWAPDLPAYYAVVYLGLACCALGTVWALRRIPGANPWYVAAAPALFFYTGHQWDIAAVFVTAIALLAFVRGRDRWGTLGLVAGVSLKLFPLAFVAAVLIERLRQRRWRSAAEIGAIFAAGTAAINLPVALANADGWSFFYRWNRDRLADAGVWVLLRGLPTSQVTYLSFAVALLGGVAITAIAWRRGGSLILPLGSAYLLWWLAINKTFTTHLVVWVFLALALLAAPRWLWGATVAVDLVGFQLGNFLNLYNVAAYQSTPLIRKAFEFIYDPLQIARSLVLFAAVGVALLAMGSARITPAAPPASTIRLPLPWRSRRGEEAVAGNGKVPPDLLGHPLPIGVPRRDPLRRRVAIGVAVAILFAAATVVMTWPYALHLRDSTVVGFDPLLQIWLSRWIQHALATDPRTLFQANIFYPFDLTLAYTDANVPGALLAAPIDLLTGDPIFTNSLLVLATFVAAAGGVYAVVVHLSGNRAAAILAGLAYAFLPYRDVHLWHLNWLESAWLPWLLLALLRLIERPTVRRGALVGLLAAVLTLTSFYFALQIGLLGGIVLLAALVARPELRSRRLAGGLAVAGAVVAILCLPLLLPYVAVRNDQGLERTAAEAEHYKASPASYLSLPPWDAPLPPLGWLGVRPGENEALTQVGQAVHADGHRHPEIVIEDALFPGALALLGAAFALAWWRRQRWIVWALAAVAGSAAILSLGPTLGPRDGSGFPLPYGFLFDHVPLFTAMRVPARLGGLADLAVVLLAGLGAAAAWRRLSPRLAEAHEGAPVTTSRSSDGRGAQSPALTLRSRLKPADRASQAQALISVLRAPFSTASRVPPQPALAGSVGSARGSKPRARLRRRPVAVATTALVGGLILLELAAVPIPLEAVDRSPAIAAPYAWLATQPPGPLMEFPAESIFADPAGSSVRRHYGLAMYWSTLHWDPLVNGNSGFIPRAYSDFIERFVGEIPRPDGSTTGRISHVDPDTVGLLQQLGVRYLLFHRSQYRAEDWPAVEAQLRASEATIERAGDFGEATIYRLRQPLPPVPAAKLTLYAPTLLGPNAEWGAWLAVDKPGDQPDGRPSVLSLTKPATLTTSWYDVDGKFLHRDTSTIPLPVVVDGPHLLCDERGCSTSVAAQKPDRLPPPSAIWRPEEPGHYVVRVAVTGDRPLSCKVDLDVVADDNTVEDLSPNAPLRWAACAEGGVAPVNDPGAVPFRSPAPSVTFVGDQIALDASLITGDDEEVQAWFLLAPPGSATPWRQAAYQSAVEQKQVQAGETASFDWLARVGGSVPPGVYGLTVWFHHRVGATWEHALGGGYALSPVVVAPDGAVRWAGPVRLSPPARSPVLAAGRPTTLDLGVDGTTSEIACDADWRLFAADDRQVAHGHAGRCSAPRIDLPASVLPGAYRLEIAATAVRDTRRDLSDAVSLPVVVRDAEVPGEPR